MFKCSLVILQKVIAKVEHKRAVFSCKILKSEKNPNKNLFC